MAWQTDSLEGQLRLTTSLLVILQLTLCGILLFYLAIWQVILLSVLVVLISSFFLKRLSKKILSSFSRASIQMDALQNQDYSLFAKKNYSHGKVAEFHQQLNTLSYALQTHKSQYDEQSFLLYRLIDQLNTPILVFDHRQRLSYANAAFSTLYDCPWQSMRHSSAAHLGLCAEPHWHFQERSKSLIWQIRSSSFLDQGDVHHLLVVTNIQTALRENQLQSWKNLIRVLSHEIRNSLTPVAALTQRLQDTLDDACAQEALALISERCDHLQNFVRRYSELHKPLQLQPEIFTAETIFQRLNILFAAEKLQGTGLQLTLRVDGTFLQQVLINLIKNAIEAGSPSGTIKLQFIEYETVIEIKVIDRGQGIAQNENLFVPFYTTKAQGQGIGLSLCRHIVEQMSGQLTLTNNLQGRGACALIRLPRSVSYNSSIPD